MVIREELQQTCEERKCSEEVFSSCHRCYILLCYNHFIEDTEDCIEHENLNQIPIVTSDILNKVVQPECFVVEGNEREEQV